MFFYIEGSSRKWIHKDRKSKQCEKMAATHNFESSNGTNGNSNNEFSFTDLKLLIPDDEANEVHKDFDEHDEAAYSSFDEEYESLSKNGSNEDAKDSSFENVSFRNILK